MATEATRIGLDNAAFQGRLKVPGLVQRPIARPIPRRVAPKGGVDGMLGAKRPQIQVPPPKPTSPVIPPVIGREASPLPAAILDSYLQPSGKKAYKPRLQTILTAMAVLVFGLGVFVNIQTMLANRSNSAQVSALSKQADTGSSSNHVSVPSTVQPTPQAVTNYVVAPNLPRYINIPKLGVHARVLQVSVTSSGALGTPNNVYDAAWYTGSAEPGQSGAVLIDGHVSSWTSHGVFYGLHTLVTGDKIQIERGDGTMFTYQVVKTVVYPSGNVDMQSAMTPVTPGKSGLNLITCTGQVIKGTSEFNQRVIVYAEQI